MVKAIMLSIRPKYVSMILNKTKTIEVRKRFPKDYKGWVYIYCTKEEYLLRTNKGYIASKKGIAVGGDSEYTFAYSDEGTVVARFWCDKVEEIVDIVSQKYEFDGLCESYGTKTLKTKSLLDKAQLNHLELADYLNDYTPFGYAIHIDNLEIFVRPKELGEFMPAKWDKCGIKDKNGLYQCNKCPYGFSEGYYCECRYKPLTKAPQSWCYVEVEE